MKTVPWVIIAILLLVILYLRECTPKPECPPSIVRVDTLPRDTVIHDTTIYKPTLVYRDTGSTRWLDQDIDTAAILAACMAVNHYRDTLMNDTSALVVVENEVSMNELLSTKVEYKCRQSFRPVYYQINEHKPFMTYLGININTNGIKYDVGLVLNLFLTKNHTCGFIYFPESKTLGLCYLKAISFK